MVFTFDNMQRKWEGAKNALLFPTPHILQINMCTFAIFISKFRDKHKLPFVHNISISFTTKMSKIAEVM